MSEISVYHAAGVFSNLCRNVGCCGGTAATGPAAATASQFLSRYTGVDHRGRCHQGNVYPDIAVPLLAGL